MVYDLLQLKLEQVRRGELRRLPFDYCVTSYLNDWLRCKDGTKRYVREQAAYARMWGWSRAWVCKNWRRIEEEAARWRSFYSTDGSERSVNAESTRSEQNSGANERKLPIPAQKRHVSERSVNDESTRSERSVNTYLEDPSDQQNKEEEKRLLETARARAREDDALGIDVQDATLDELPADTLRYRKQINALAAADPDARQRYGFKALRAGQLPAPEVHRLYEQALIRAGPVLVSAALIVTANEAQARYATQRIKHFNAVLDTLIDHVQRNRLGINTGADCRPAGQVGTNGKEGGQALRRHDGAGGHPGSIAGRDRRYTATERASQTTIRGNLELVREMRERRERGDAGSNGQGAHDAGYGE